MTNKKKRVLITSLLVLLIGGSAYVPPDEGMFPLSELKNVNLNKAGLKIDQKEIYNTETANASLVDALVRVGGCTGSFISDAGLIITNHHCAFSAVQLASTPEHDYLENGFVAQDKASEIEAKGMTCRITDSYEDVSDKILSSVASVSDPASRIRIINAEMKKLASEAEAQDSTIEAEVSEMFIGKTYVLFRYKTIKDVRLVYVPSRNVGEFGGETDNWVWPRHTGDFSFMRAYVAPDGSPASYSKSNVPYEPKKFLKVNADGVNENDFVFILGYPGRTFRHRPAQFIEHQQNFLLPYVSNLYEFQNKMMAEAGKKSRATDIRLATRVKRNANVMKNYNGKLKGLKGLELVKEKKQEDEALAAYINENVELKARYGSLMSDIDNLYKLIFNDAYREMWLAQIYASTSLLDIARQINSFKVNMNSKPVADRNQYFAENVGSIKKSLLGKYDSFDIDADKAIFTRMLEDAAKLPKNQRIAVVDKQVIKGFNAEEQIDKFVSSRYQYTRLKDKNYVMSLILKSPKSLSDYSDPLLLFESEISDQINVLQPEKERREGQLNKLMGDYVAVKERFKQRDFIPDANSTLRLTYGYVRGFSPADATYMKPFTTIKGMLEKGSTDNPEFTYPPKIKQLWLAKDFGPFVKKDLNDVPVSFLYNLDTTGGNSGSPVMNDKGELIGVNFDRAYEATINDYAWNENYSRSIGVDIRYVLWVASKVDNANFLLEEIGVKP
ncbi:peptidase S46-like protein [Arcticibacter pallidicorallinus]|uniref:Dipeptidyl-peptidase n=2 Tax=Arcticibacter pallidicorallinus TaxID=1259464 RepID=A0A2T0TXJ6_9SPHI|nr:S46 family peptidase [Arcticibacter pallidicorallinus]PRY50405.1 peptidase S46-like protein [Arcticibacter pallidicorallinus]